MNSHSIHTNDDDDDHDAEHSDGASSASSARSSHSTSSHHSQSSSQSQSSISSAASAQRLRRERTQRHRQRLQRVKQLQAHTKEKEKELLSQQQHQQQQQQERQQQQQQQQQDLPGHRRNSSESSSGSGAASVASSGITSSRRRLALGSSRNVGVSAGATAGGAGGGGGGGGGGVVGEGAIAAAGSRVGASQQHSLSQTRPQQPAQASHSLTPQQQQQQQQYQRNKVAAAPAAAGSKPQQGYNANPPPPPSNNPPITASNSNNPIAANKSTSSSPSNQAQPANPSHQTQPTSKTYTPSHQSHQSQQSQQQPPPPPPPKNPNPNPLTLNPTSSNLSSSQTSHSTHQSYTPHTTTHKSGPVLVSVESPLPPLVLRSLGDRSYDKRKNAALEIEQLVKSLSEANNTPMIQSIISVLSKDFCTSMNANYRKGGLIGIAATAIGLMGSTRAHLEGLLFPVLHCFDDPESRVRYYACESLYNIAKVARGAILRYFNQIFDGLTKLFADVDVDVKNGANLLDRLVKDIVTESESFHVEHFLPLLQTYIRRTNPYIRQLLVGWITVLDSVPDISMIDYLPDFLDGLFNMLSDSNREIRQAADSALSDFLKEVRHSTVLEFGPLVSILVNQCLSKDRLNRLTAITWIEELIHHPHSGGDALLPHHAEVLGAILYCISDSEDQICLVAERTNADLLTLVRDTQGSFLLSPLLATLTEKFMTKDDVPTKMASLRWINMLLEKRRGDMTEFVKDLLPVLLKTLADASDAVVLFTLQVLARISLGDGGSRLEGLEEGETGGESKESQDSIHCGLLRGKKDEKHFKLVINAILGLFASDRMLLENRGSLVVRKFCVLLDAESVYMLMSDVLSASCEGLNHGTTAQQKEGAMEDVEKGPSMTESTTAKSDHTVYSLEFVSTMVQTLNLILLTATELHGLRVLLAKTFDSPDSEELDIIASSNPGDEHFGTRNGVQVFESLFRCWCHSPVATFSLCLLARSYSVAFALVQKFSELEVTVGFLMQIDKLVQLLESPVFVHLRLQLLDVESPHHAPLLKSCYGLLMLLPQSDAFRSLNDRLTTVCNLRDNLGIVPPSVSGSSGVSPSSPSSTRSTSGSLSKRQMELLTCFDEVMELHRKLRGRETQQIMAGELIYGRNAPASLNAAGSVASGKLVAGRGGKSFGGSVVGGSSVASSGIGGNLNGSSSVFFTGSEHSASSLTGGPSVQNRGRITQEV